MELSTIVKEDPLDAEDNIPSAGIDQHTLQQVEQRQGIPNVWPCRVFVGRLQEQLLQVF